MEREVQINKWLDIIGYDKGQKEQIRAIFQNEQIKIVESDISVFCYMILPDLKGGLSMVEIFFYVIKEHRTLKNCNKLLEEFEKIAYDNKCKSIKFGSNFGHRDDTFMEYLIRKGYKHDTVSKEL